MKVTIVDTRTKEDITSLEMSCVPNVDDTLFVYVNSDTPTLFTVTARAFVVNGKKCECRIGV